MPEGSYTTSLFKKGVNKMAQKVGEEAVETIIEATNGNNENGDKTNDFLGQHVASSSLLGTC